MARIRTIRPDFFTDEGLVTISAQARLLFIGLWTLADREGRLQDRPVRIKMQLFPCDDADVDALLDELATIGCITRYMVDRARYISVRNFTKFQKPHRNESASVLPAVPRNGTPHSGNGMPHEALRTENCESDSLNPVKEDEQLPDLGAIGREIERATGSLLSTQDINTVSGWCRVFSDDEIRSAVKKAAAAGKVKVPYIGGILNNGVATEKPAMSEPDVDQWVPK